MRAFAIARLSISSPGTRNLISRPFQCPLQQKQMAARALSSSSHSATSSSSGHFQAMPHKNNKRSRRGKAREQTRPPTSLWIRRKALECLLDFQSSTQGGLNQGYISTLKGLVTLNLEAGGDRLHAQQLLEQLLHLQGEFYGTDEHPEVIDTLRKQVELMASLGQPKGALEAMERLLIAVRRQADGEDNVEVVMTMRDAARAKGFVRDHGGKKALLERTLLMQLRLFTRTQNDDGVGGSMATAQEIARTKCFLGAAHAGLGELEEVNQVIDQLLDVLQPQQQQQQRGSTTTTATAIQSSSFAPALSLLYTKALVEGELGRPQEKVELLQELVVLQTRLAEIPALPSATATLSPTHALLDTLLELADAYARLRKREEAQTLLQRTTTMQEEMLFTPRQAVDITLRTALVWGQLGQLGTRLRMLERVLMSQELFLAAEGVEGEGGALSETLVQTHVELSEAVRLMGDRKRADALLVKAHDMRSEMEKVLGFSLEDDQPQNLRVAGAMEKLGEEWC